MRISDNKPIAPARPVGAGPVDRRLEPGQGPAAVQDSANVLGIPETELTPKVRDAIMALMREVERLRQELSRSNARLADLEKLADTDALVPLHNRRAFVREMSRLMHYGQRYKVAASLIFFDVNEMKEINDTYGHAAGDAALHQIATTLVENVRESDLVGRLGGDEFGVVLAYSSEETARRKAEQLARAIASRPLVWQGKKINIEVAWGVHGIVPGTDAGAALAAADRAMYERKAQMRRRD